MAPIFAWFEPWWFLPLARIDKKSLWGSQTSISKFGWTKTPHSGGMAGSSSKNGVMQKSHTAVSPTAACYCKAERRTYKTYIFLNIIRLSSLITLTSKKVIFFKFKHLFFIFISNLFHCCIIWPHNSLLRILKIWLQLYHKKWHGKTIRFL